MNRFKAQILLSKINTNHLKEPSKTKQAVFNTEGHPKIPRVTAKYSENIHAKLKDSDDK